MRTHIILKDSIIKTILCLLSLMFFLSINLYAQNQERTQNRYRYGQTGNALNIVCSFSDYASIAEYIAGDRAIVSYIAHGEQDPHFVPPKPSYAVTLSTADIWITTGMDLEMWSASLIDKAHNRKSMGGWIGFVSVSDGINILEKIEFVSR